MTGMVPRASISTGPVKPVPPDADIGPTRPAAARDAVLEQHRLLVAQTAAKCAAMAGAQ